MISKAHLVRALAICGCILLLAGGTLTNAAGSAVTGTTSVGRHPEADVVVWLDTPPSPATAPAPRVVLDQRNLAFAPHVLAVRVGTRVEMPNDDRVFHNVFSFHNGKRFDLGLYPVGTVRYVTFDQPGLSRVFCNIHPNMAAYVMAVDSTAFAVSDAAGRFDIRSVDPGTYRYHAWRAAGPELTGSITVQTGSALDIHWP